MVAPVFPGAVAREHDHRPDVVLRHHAPKVLRRGWHGVLRDDEGLVVVVALDEAGVDVSGVRPDAVWSQDDPVPVERNDGRALVLDLVLFVGA